jgi:LuxR family transcriptional regulator, maltose regulon positive regulatory protein
MNPKVYSDKTMRDNLLATKLYIPAARPDSVWRPRLFEYLNAGITGKLTLLSGPAGFGKTSLARDWVLGLDKPVAWLSLDEGDNDLVRFFLPGCSPARD